MLIAFVLKVLHLYHDASVAMKDVRFTSFSTFFDNNFFYTFCRKNVSDNEAAYHIIIYLCTEYYFIFFYKQTQRFYSILDYKNFLNCI